MTSRSHPTVIYYLQHGISAGGEDGAHPCASETAVIVFCVYCKPPIRDEASREQLSRARGCKPRSLFLTYLREFRVRRDPVYGAHTPDYSFF